MGRPKYYTNKTITTLKREAHEILRIKKHRETENACNGVISRLDVEERIYEHEDKSLEVTQTENKEIKM